MINDIVKRGDLVRIYTQNTDGLEVRCPWLSDELLPGTKNPFSNMVAVHGSINKMGCRKCRQV
jgi:NAD-dependent SIR2 family protein deacetylase